MKVIGLAHHFDLISAAEGYANPLCLWFAAPAAAIFHQDRLPRQPLQRHKRLTLLGSACPHPWLRPSFSINSELRSNALLPASDPVWVERHVEGMPDDSVAARVLMKPFSHAIRGLDCTFHAGCRLRHSRSNRRQPAGNSNHLGEPFTERLALAVPSTITETKPVSNVHLSSARRYISPGDNH